MLKVTVVKGVPDVVIKLEGSLDMGTGHSLQRTVEELDLDRIHNLTVSLSGLDIIDSTGSGQLIGYHRILSRKNGRVVIENDNREIEEILGLIGVREILGSWIFPAHTGSIPSRRCWVISATAWAAGCRRDGQSGPSIASCWPFTGRSFPRSPTAACASFRPRSIGLPMQGTTPS